jgi:hypothetical protein
MPSQFPPTLRHDLDDYRPRRKQDRHKQGEEDQVPTDTTWQAVRKSIKDAFGIDDAPAKPVDALLTLSDVVNAQPSVPQVSLGFTFTENQEDQNHFRYLHIEPLLDECCALLDRSLTDRAVYQNLGVEYFKVKLEILEFLRLDAIHDEERAAQVYEVPHAEAAGMLNSENALATGDNATSPYYGGLKNFVISPKKDRRLQVAAVSAQNASLPFYSDPNPPFCERTRQFPTREQFSATRNAIMAGVL